MAQRLFYLSQPIIQRLPILLRELQSGEVRVPRFQRPFIWKIDQRLELFRSIYEGIPIGSFLLWRTSDHDLECYDHLGPLRMDWASGEREEPSVKVRQYLLDGHQRLTTLYVGLGEGLIPEELTGGLEEDLDEADDGKPADQWPLYFDLDEREFQPPPRHGKVPATWFPLSILLDPFKLYEFQKGLIEAGLDRTLVNRAESLASTFKDYSIPVVPIVTEDLELATKSFQRVNSGGTKMNEVHMISALTWSRTFDLNGRIKEVKEDLEEVGWRSLEEKMILNVCKAALDLDIYYARTEEIQSAIKDRPQVLEEAAVSLRMAAHFLRERCRIYGPAVLPYSFQIVLLADAIRCASWKPEQSLDSSAHDNVESWFWITTYAEHFGGISGVRMDRTLHQLRRVAQNLEAPDPPGMSREVRPLPRRFDFRSARSRVIALRLATLASHERHDPFQLLADLGRDAMPLLIPSRAVQDRAAEGPENRVLVHPRELSRLRRTLQGSAELFEDAKLLDSHAIDHHTAAALAAGDLKKFLQGRREAIASLERKHIESLGLKVAGE